jgi:nondiscriminating aspartyl-tRNA synthetase
MGFIENFSDIMDTLEMVLKRIMNDVERNCKAELQDYASEFLVPDRFPRIKLTEAMDVLKKEYNKQILGVDIDPEGEKLISEWAKKTYNSDFIFLTHYPTSARPFYTMPSSDPQYTESFDLIYRGVEIVTGGQRIHNPEQLVASIKRHHLDPKDFKDYIEIFRLGMPPHGGWAIGSERLAQKILGLPSIKQAILFPRDVRRLTP